jgi:hypothetical protein
MISGEHSYEILVVLSQLAVAVHSSVFCVRTSILQDSLNRESWSASIDVVGLHSTHQNVLIRGSRRAAEVQVIGV